MSFDKPDIINVLEKEDVELKQRGKALWSLCPLHSEKKPSFKVDPERQIFYCFGCHEHGDVIHFIQKYKNLNFKEALRYLGISGKPIRPDTWTIRKRELVKAFKQWCYQYYDDLCYLYRTLQQAKIKVKTIQQVENLAPLYHKESVWQWHIEILLDGDEETKFHLYQEIIGNAKV